MRLTGGAHEVGGTWLHVEPLSTKSIQMGDTHINYAD